MSIALHISHVTFILRCAIIASEGFSRFTMILGFLSLSFCDMFFAIGGGLKNIICSFAAL